MTRLSCHRFRSNEFRLWLGVIAYNLGNLWRRLVLPKKIEKWSLAMLQQRLVQTGGRLLKHARYYWLLLTESPSDAAALGSHAGQDRSVALAHRVSEPTTGWDFSDARGTGRQSVAGVGRKGLSFRLWGSRERQNGTIRGPWERLEVQIQLPVALRGGQDYLLGRRKGDNGNSG